MVRVVNLSFDAILSWDFFFNKEENNINKSIREETLKARLVARGAVNFFW